MTTLTNDSSKYNCELTKENVEQIMAQKGLKATEFKTSLFGSTKNYLNFAAVLSIDYIEKKVNDLYFKASKRSFSEKDPDSGTSIDFEFKYGIKLSVDEDNHLTVSFEIGLKKPFELSIPILATSISKDIIKLETTTEDDNITYALKLDLDFKNIDWTYNVAELVIPKYVEVAIIIAIKALFDGAELFSKTFIKKTQLPSVEDFDKEIDVILPYPEAENIAYATNSKHNTLVLAWIEGNSGINNKNIALLSKQLNKSKNSMRLIVSPYFIYYKVSNIVEQMLKGIRHEVGVDKFQGSNVFYFSMKNVKAKVKINSFKFIFTDNKNKLGAIFSTEVNKVITASLGYCIDFYISSPKAEQGESTQKLTIILNRGFLQVGKLKNEQVAIFAGALVTILYTVLTLFGGIVDAKNLANKIVSQIIHSQFIDFPVDFPEGFPKLNELLAVPASALTLFNESQWIAADFD